MPIQKKKKGNYRKNTAKSIKRFLKENFGRLFLICFFSFLLTVGYFVYDLPDINQVKPIDTKPSITILANDGSEIASFGNRSHRIVGLDEIPQYLIDAVISVEDRRFYSHFGIDPLGIARAMAANLRAGSFSQGGSTITQQLTKNLFLSPDKTIKRKIQEALMAIQIEKKYSKDEILAAYLNRVYLGSGAYGVEAAAQTYFGKSVKDLNLWESAIIAGLLKAPSRYSPNNNLELSQNRAKTVINTMKDAGYIDAKLDVEKLKKIGNYKSPADNKDMNNYFADWIINQIDSFITTTDGDIVVRTTLDPRMQKDAEETILDLHKRISTNNKVEQIALVTQAYDGAVLAMVGGVNYEKSQFNRATQALRQTGSAFKPFIYLSAIENGFSPEDYIEDSPIEEGSYHPSNYGDKYYGSVTLQKALQKSLNSAAVRLLQKTGLKSLNDVAKRSGLHAKINQDLSAALGTTEIPLITMNNAYTIFANGGKSVWPYAVVSIEDSNGETLYQRVNPEFNQVFKKQDIKQLDSMLETVLHNEGTGRNAKFGNEYMAGKTGTSQDNRNAWFIGFTDKYVTGVWMGNDDNSPMLHVTGGNFPAILWGNYMRKASKIELPKSLRYIYGKRSFFDMLGRWSTDTNIIYNE